MRKIRREREPLGVAKSTFSLPGGMALKAQLSRWDQLADFTHIGVSHSGVALGAGNVRFGDVVPVVYLDVPRAGDFTVQAVTVCPVTRLHAGNGCPRGLQLSADHARIDLPVEANSVDPQAYGARFNVAMEAIVCGNGVRGLFPGVVILLHVVAARAALRVGCVPVGNGVKYDYYYDSYCP